MEDDRWQRVKALYDQALELSPAGRAAFLDRCAAEDPAVADEVGSLVRSHEEAGRFIETPAGVRLARRVGTAGLAPGTMVGAYRIEGEVGHGGMGTVYRATRADGAFDKAVALKLVRPGLDSDEIVRRFHQERQTLAGLEHPNIARLLDGGSTTEGQPYFIMEFVEGTSIVQYCDAHALSIAERLALFATVAHAVHAAHRNLVVHRDLKPDNILVTADGVPKLVDFGIAKMLAAGLPSGAETSGTRGLMTPEYASPEQILGKPITTAADVFSLGVLLHELATGHRPFGASAPTVEALAREICEHVPERPSQIVMRPLRTTGPSGETIETAPGDLSARRKATPASLRRQLAGDVDAIIDMALRKEPERRHGSAEQLAEDVERHLSGRPVIARRGAVGYRVGRFMKRHAVGMAAAALVVVAVAAGVAGVAWQARMAAAERDRARVEAEKAQQISQFLQDMLEAPSPSNQGRNVTVAETLDRAAARLNREKGDRPEVRSAIQRALGVTYGSLGLYDAAETQLRAALAAAPRTTPDDGAAAAATETDLADVISERGDDAEAERLYRHALAVFDELGLADDVRRADALNGLGEVRRSQGDDGPAEQYYRQALEIRRRRLGDRHVLVAESLNNLAVVMHARNELVEAERLYRESLEIVRAARGDDHPGVPITLGNIATVTASLGKLDESERLYREALAIRRRLLGEDHPALAMTKYQLAETLLVMGRFRDVEELGLDILSRRGRSLPSQHPLAAAGFLMLGRARLALGDAQGAEAPLREALAIRRAILQPGHWQTASAESFLGRALAAQRRFDEAEPLVVGAYERLAADRGPRHERTVDALAGVVSLYEAWGKPERAAEYKAKQAR